MNIREEALNGLKTIMDEYLDRGYSKNADNQARIMLRIANEVLPSLNTHSCACLIIVNAIIDGDAAKALLQYADCTNRANYEITARYVKRMALEKENFNISYDPYRGFAATEATPEHSAHIVKCMRAKDYIEMHAKDEEILAPAIALNL